MNKYIAWVLFVMGMALLNGWLWMLALGALSHIFNIPNLAIGYWPAVLVAFIGNLFISKFRNK